MLNYYCYYSSGDNSSGWIIYIYKKKKTPTQQQLQQPPSLTIYFQLLNYNFKYGCVSCQGSHPIPLRFISILSSHSCVGPPSGFEVLQCKHVTYAIPKSRNLVPSSSGIMSASSDNMMFVRWEFLITMGTSTNKLSYPILRFLSASGVNSLSLYICIAWGVRRYAFTVRKPRAVFWVSVEINKINWYSTAYTIIYDRWDLESAWKM